MLVTLLSSSLFLLLVCGGLFAFQLVTARQNTEQLVSTLVDTAAGDIATAMKSRDLKSAEAKLGSLCTNTAIRSAWIQSKDGTLFAQSGLETTVNHPKRKSEPGLRFPNEQPLLEKPVLLQGKPIGTLFVKPDFESVHAQLVRSYAGVSAGVMILSVAFALGLSARLHRVISEPFLRLATTVPEIASRREDGSEPSQTDPGNGFDLFTADVNQMFAQIRTQDTALQQAHLDLKQQVAALQHEVSERKQTEARLNELHKQLLDASRQAGMAEVATGVLHSVGNVLNSVNVSVTLLHDRLRQSKTAKLTKVVKLLQEHKDDLGAFLTTDSKGRMIPGYLNQLSVHLEKESSDILEIMELVVKNMEHIKKIVTMQQKYAKVVAVTETLPPANLLEDALQIHAASLDRDGVKVLREYGEVPPVTVDKHKALQILVNLVHNAKCALEEGGQQDKLLRLGITRNGDNRVKISVADTGIGIKPENLTRIFSHGFTTRKNGHGFGLHSSALAAKELRGSLKVHSDGPGRGATFTLELPFEETKVKA